MKLKKLFAISLAFVLTVVLSPISQNMSDNEVITANAGDDNGDSEREVYNRPIIDEKYNITYSNNKGRLTLVKCDANTSGQIELPSEYDGMPVVEIGKEAFKNCSKITYVRIPDSVTYIGPSAFENCTGLERIGLNRVNFIDDYAFKGCTQLISPTLHDSVETLGIGVFMNCDKISTVQIGKGIETISKSTFENCTNLDWVIMKGDIKRIGERAFYNCEKLEAIDIPLSVTEIDKMAFANCKSLQVLNFVKNISEIDMSVISQCNNMSGIYIYNPECKFVTYEKSSEKSYDLSELSKKITINGYKNSTAEKFAKDNEFKFWAMRSYGDTNADGKINSVDASHILSLYAKNTLNKSKPSNYDLEICDINKDGAVNAVDASYVLSYYAYTATNKNSVSLTDYMKQN